MGKRKGAPSRANEEPQASDDTKERGLSTYELERKRLCASFDLSPFFKYDMEITITQSFLFFLLIPN